jgi:hypothetical protein
MQLERLWQLARLAAGMPAYLREPVCADRARREIADRLSRRRERFVEAMRRLVFDRSESPFARLLAWAGVSPDALASLVNAAGIEAALEDLRDRGVYLTLDEVRGRVPVCRDGLVIELDDDAFSNPLLGAGLTGRSSGTRSAGTAVAYTWPFLAEEAAAECLLYEDHGLGRSAAAMWLPGPPGIAGIHNLLLHLKTGRPPARWFSHTPPPSWRSPVNRAALRVLLSASRACGVPAPSLEHLTIDRAIDAARWLAEGRTQGSARSLKTYASSAVRVAVAAREYGLDMSGAVVFTGGEAMTSDRRRYIESTGLTVRPRYVTTESGLVGGACEQSGRDAPDTMHVYQDRLALIEGPQAARVGGRQLRSLAFTSLSLHTPRVLLNTELGDYGVLDTHECPCAFGMLGMHQHVSHVTSPEKLTAEGMNVATGELQRIVGELVAAAGGSPNDYQLRTGHTPTGLSTIALVVHPSVRGLDDEALLLQVWEALERAGGGERLAATLWRASGALCVLREPPRETSGHKLLPVDEAR